MVIATLAGEFRKVKALADGAIAQLDDAQLHARIDPEANSVAMLMHHLAGNMRSRWTDFLTSDGEKPWRQRDAEFEPPPGDRTALLATWDAGWTTLFAALDRLEDDDLARPVTIRGESQTALAAIARQLAHYAGHGHQIVLLAKHLRGADWRVLSIPRGQSQAYTARLRATTPSSN
jgi:uncharacterized damage-inducible protein DinB